MAPHHRRGHCPVRPGHQLRVLQAPSDDIHLNPAGSLAPKFSDWEKIGCTAVLLSSLQSIVLDCPAASVAEDLQLFFFLYNCSSFPLSQNLRWSQALSNPVPHAECSVGHMVGTQCIVGTRHKCHELMSWFPDVWSWFLLCPESWKSCSWMSPLVCSSYAQFTWGIWLHVFPSTRQRDSSVSCVKHVSLILKIIYFMYVSVFSCMYECISCIHYLWRPEGVRFSQDWSYNILWVLNLVCMCCVCVYMCMMNVCVYTCLCWVCVCVCACICCRISVEVRGQLAVVSFFLLPCGF